MGCYTRAVAPFRAMARSLLGKPSVVLLLLTLLCCGCQSQDYYRARAQYVQDWQWCESHPDPDDEMFFQAKDDYREMMRLKK